MKNKISDGELSQISEISEDCRDQKENIGLITKKVRNSTIELLRIFSMLLVVISHYGVHGINYLSIPFSFNQMFITPFPICGNLGVLIFVLISSYYMLNSKFTFKKLLKLFAEVLFYSYIMLLLFVTILKTPISIGMEEILKSIFPIGTGMYWFVTIYIILMLISPCLNFVINRLSNEKHLSIILISSLIWSIIPIFLKIDYVFNNIIWFIIIYFIATYIKKYVNTENKNSSKHFLIACITLIILICMCYMFCFIANRTNNQNYLRIARYFCRRNSIFILIVAIEIFIGFIKLKPINNRFINKIAATTFGVYLIHENLFMRPYIWHTLLNCPKYSTSNLLVIHFLISIVSVYVICTIIDLIRQVTFGKLGTIFLNKFYDKFINFCKIQ